MEINLNCDLGEGSIHYNGKNDVSLLKFVNSASIACGYHAGNKYIMTKTIKEAKNNHVSIGAHPGFKDLLNFGRKKIYLSQRDLIKLIWEQLEIINKIAISNNVVITHVKLHGSLNNMACKNIEMALTISKTIKKFNKELIFLILPLTEMEKALNKLDLKHACEIFADRNYEDSGQLVSRKKKNAIIDNHEIVCSNIIEMLDSSSIKCFSGKKIKCNIDTICIHGDLKNSVLIAKQLKIILTKNNFKLLALDNMIKFK